MNKGREVDIILNDCRPRAMVAHDALYAEVVAELEAVPELLFTTSVLDFQTRNDPRLFKDAAQTDVSDTADFVTTLETHRGERALRPDLNEADLAMLVYTSGTTGEPKGAMSTHAGAIFTADNTGRWTGLRRGAPILGLAPLFHITGLVVQMLLAFVQAAPLILSFRFDPGVMIDSIEEHRAEFVIGAITALIAIMNPPRLRPEQLRSVTTVASGGAPVPPSVGEQFRRKFGLYVHNGYGLTETNSAVIFAPLGHEAPVHAESGTLSIGVPLPNIFAWIADEESKPLPVGETGEIIVHGPSLVCGYRNKPEESANAIRADGLRTGDVGFMDRSAGFIWWIARRT
jgi:long-chain acyl-CoA synthetase